MVIKKWVKKDGSFLTKQEYNSLSTAAYKKNIPLIDYLSMYGIKNKYSVGYLQDPLFNSAELTKWVKNVDGEWLFLTKWKYKQFSEEIKGREISITDYLIDNGYVMWKELFDYDITGWININSKLPLSRKEYIAISNKSDNNRSISDILTEYGYVKINEAKKEVLDTYEFYDKEVEILFREKRCTG